MNLQSFLSQQFLMACGFSVSLALAAGLGAQSAQAQTSADLLAAPQPGQTTDPFSNRGSNGNSSVMQLMQKLMQGPRRDAGEVAAEQKAGLDDATAAFRAKQQALLKSQPPAATSGVVSPGTAILLTPVPAVPPNPAPLLLLPAAKP